MRLLVIVEFKTDNMFESNLGCIFGTFITYTRVTLLNNKMLNNKGGSMENYVKHYTNTSKR